MKELTFLPCFNPECKCKEIYMHKAVVCGKEIFFAECENDWCSMHGQAKDTEKEAIEAWNSLPRALTWTTEPPKVPGWYWFDEEKIEDDLRYYNGKKICGFSGDDCEEYCDGTGLDEHAINQEKDKIRRISGLPKD